MATISLRIDEPLRAELEDLAKSQDVSVSEIIRQAIEGRLGRDVKQAWSAPRSMSKFDRHQLALLHEVLAQFDPDEADYHRSRADVLNRGFTGEYGAEFVAVEDELALSDCKLLWDILDMFRVIKASVANIGITKIRSLDAHAEATLTFGGFDLNDELEGQLLSYAQYLVAHDRWADLAEHFGENSDRGNSHCPKLDVYRRMLEAYRPIWQRLISGHGRGADRYVLTETELAELIQASRYPR